MRVSEVSSFGDPDVLRPGQRPWPLPGPREVVIAVQAAAVNPADLAARSGAVLRRIPDLRPPFVPGWDLAGVVDQVGSGANGYSPGDPVLGLIPWMQEGGRLGAYAEAAAVHLDWLAPRPAGLDPVTAATLPLNALTARQALDLIALPRGGTLLVTGASGAVGGFAVQLAARDGLRVIAIASAGDEAWVSSLGASEVLPRGVDLTTLDAVDAVLDAVPLGAAAVAPLRADGVAVFTRRVDAQPARGQRFETPLVHPDARELARLAKLVDAGALRTRVAEVLDLAQAAEAHRLLERGGLRGKLVLST